MIQKDELHSEKLRDEFMKKFGTFPQIRHDYIEWLESKVATPSLPPSEEKGVEEAAEAKYPYIETCLPKAKPGKPDFNRTTGGIK